MLTVLQRVFTSFTIVLLVTPAAAAQGWTFDVMAETGSAGITAIDSACSMNDSGMVAFAGTDSTGSRVFVSSTPGTVTPIKNAVAGWTYAGASISNKGGANGPYVVTRKIEPGPLYWIYRFEAGAPPTQSGTFIAPSTAYDSAQLFVDCNSQGRTAFSAQVGGATAAALFLGPTSPDPYKNIVQFAPASTAIRPQISENNWITIRNNANQILLYKYFNSSLIVPETIAGTTAPLGGFTSVGREPGISGDGSVVAFIGNKGGVEGFYLSVETPSGRQLVEVAGGTTGDGFTDFDELQRAGVVSYGAFTSNPAHYAAFVKTVTIAFIGTRFGITGVHSKTLSLRWYGSAIEVRTVQDTRVVALGDVINGKTVSALRVYRPVNERRKVCFHASFSGGGSAVVRATPPVREVRISFKRVLNQAGSSAWSSNPGQLVNIIDDVNLIWEKYIGIRFVLDGLFEDIQEPTWFNMEQSVWEDAEKQAESDPCRFRWRTDAANVYLINDFYENGVPQGAAAKAALRVLGDPSKNDLVVMAYTSSLSLASLNLAHELGHHFGLLHTFHTHYGAEPTGTCSIPSPQGLTAGDLVEDTPQDPFIVGLSLVQNLTLLNNQYSGCADVSYGVEKNVMAYYFPSIAEARLTPGQMNRAWGIGAAVHSYSFVDGPPIPSISNVTPSSSGHPGPTSLTLSGANFPTTGGLSVTLKDQASSSVNGSATNLTVNFASPIGYGAHCVCLREHGDLVAWISDGITVPIGPGLAGCAGAHVPGVQNATLGSTNLQFTCSNAPTWSLGVAFVYDAADPGAPDWFGIFIPIYIDLPSITLFEGIDMYSNGAGDSLAQAAVPNNLGLFEREFYFQAVWYWPSICLPSTYGLSISPALPFRVKEY